MFKFKRPTVYVHTMIFVEHIWFTSSFQADPKLLEDVIGLKPDKEKHEFYMDLQPVSL